MYKIFISDLHLDEKTSKITDIFLNLLHEESGKAEELYILGDFFEVWVGDDNLTTFNLSIMEALKKAVHKGLKIFIMHGNRDFLLGKKFIRKTGCILLPDEYVIDLYGRKTLLLHGDTLCTKDKSYLRFRKKSRNFFIQQLFLLKSLEKRRLLAKKYRAMSVSHTRETEASLLDVTQSEVEKVMRHYQVNTLIHGHTHKPATHSFTLNEESATRIVLGAWHECGNALICPAKGAWEYIHLR